MCPGLGYIGLPTASTFATHRHKGRGRGLNPNVLAYLASGEVQSRVGLRELSRTRLIWQLTVNGDTRGKLTLSSLRSDAILSRSSREIQRPGIQIADMRRSPWQREAVVPVLRQRNLVVLESTSPPRTTLDY